MSQIESLTRVLSRAAVSKNMDAAIDYLRSFNFVFFTYETLMRRKPEILKDNPIKEEHQEYSFMVHEITPMDIDKKHKGEYQYYFLLGIKLNGPKNDEIVVYKDGKYAETLHLEWKNPGGILWRKTKVGVKFPDAMSYDMRKKFRAEEKKLKRKPDREMSEFYNEWKDKIIKIQ